MLKNLYPRCKQFGIKVADADDCSVVPISELNRVFSPGTPKAEQFNRLFGVQTCPVGGMYAWDVEAVLERMTSGKLTGTQLDWD